MGEKEKKRGSTYWSFGREKKEDSRKGDFFFKENFQHALERSEDLRERRNSGDFWEDCLEEKHRGKDWQHASSSHWKPSNSSQRLVLPGIVM